jgi:mono/diheme cytochrome c family protein
MTKLAVTSLALAIVFGSGLLCSPCLAQSASVSEGRQLAQKTCATCHVIIANGPASWTDAPSFESIANRPAITQQWLTNFVQQPQHMHMLMEKYTRAQASDIAAYILSLRHTGASR